MRVYLNPGTVEKVRTRGIRVVNKLTGEFDPNSREQAFVKFDDTGIFGDDPKVPEDCIDHVTIATKISEGFVKSGVYQDGGVRAEVKVDVHYIGPGGYEETDVFQEIRLIAPDVKSAREFLSLLRQGKMEPIEHWCGHHIDPRTFVENTDEDPTPGL